ncbi:uncharacterized protein LAJ45_08210 [Morchella importuna]|uniref:uncharacterized protein n=1 Tax=Morchella importuna TaxID=1174673 RepID=UPI001E8D0554|nr:uncharacterized protein LAJ45_08210 [Morchella importuna]KAH8147745.1 hypothetical protein LAJ45_08210 [Morchella importuna]
MSRGISWIVFGPFRLDLLTNSRQPQDLTSLEPRTRGLKHGSGLVNFYLLLEHRRTAIRLLFQRNSPRVWLETVQSLYIDPTFSFFVIKDFRTYQLPALKKESQAKLKDVRQKQCAE